MTAQPLDILPAAPDADVLDLFAGPGGMSTGAAMLGLVEIGLEWDGAACATARAAGHARATLPYNPDAQRKRGEYPGPKGPDIAQLDPRAFAGAVFTRPVRGLIGCPPCQGFSTAGKGKGRDDSMHLLAALEDVRTLADVERVIAELTPLMTDPRTLLVLEPLRWALALTPSWIALEQVPAVLPLWEAIARVLRAVGYSVATGVLKAEQYDVPQTRRRAILVARAPWFTREHGPAELPKPVRSAYYSRDPERLDPGMPSWVSMADALGSGMTHRPSMTVTGGGTGAGGAEPFGHGARDGMLRELDADRWRFAGAGRTAVDTAGQWQRPTSEPASTILGGGSAAWVPEFNDQSGTPFDPEWPDKRPATAVAGRGLVQNPGATANRHNGSTKSRNDGVRVTVQEAAVLQSFPADYPWQGNATAQYRQVGDAVPPMLAWHVLKAAAAL